MSIEAKVRELAYHYLDGDGAPDIEASVLRLVHRLVRAERDGCAALCDAEARRSDSPDNRRSSDLRAAFQSGACRCAWVIRQRSVQSGS